MRLSRALKDKLMDVRIRDKLLFQGKITKEQVDKYMAELGDDNNNMTLTESNEKKRDIVEERFESEQTPQGEPGPGSSTPQTPGFSQ